MPLKTHALVLAALMLAGVSLMMAPVGCKSTPSDTGNARSAAVAANAENAFRDTHGVGTGSPSNGTVTGSNNADRANTNAHSAINEMGINNTSRNNTPSANNNGSGNGSDATDHGEISLQQARDNWPNNRDPRFPTAEWLLGYGSAAGLDSEAQYEAEKSARNDIAAYFKATISSTLRSYDEERVSQSGGDETREGFSRFSFDVEVFVNETISGTEILDRKRDETNSVWLALAGLYRPVFARNLRDKIEAAIDEVERAVVTGDTHRQRGDLLRAVGSYRGALESIVKIRIWLEQYRLIRYEVPMRDCPYTTGDIYALIHACSRSITVAVAAQVLMWDDRTQSFIDDTTLARSVAGAVAGALGNSTIRVVTGSSDFLNTPMETLERLGADELRDLLGDDEVNYVLMGTITVNFSSSRDAGNSGQIHYYKGEYSFQVFSLSSGTYDSGFSQSPSNRTEASSRTHSTAARTAFEKTYRRLADEIKDRFGG